MKKNLWKKKKKWNNVEKELEIKNKSKQERKGKQEGGKWGLKKGEIMIIKEEKIRE